VSERALPLPLPLCRLPSACSLLRSCCCSSITTAGPSGLVVDTLLAASRNCTLALHRPRHCLPCPVWLCWIAPAARENPLPPPHSDRHSRTSSHQPSQLHQGCCVARPSRPGSDSSPPRQSLLAQALISPTSRRLCLLVSCSSIATCDLLDLAASATVSAPSPCAAAVNNNATASDQPFACGRPIHLATSSPNERAGIYSSLA
jgi:hypothetical protein